MEALSWLDLEKDELVPAWGDGFDGDDLGLGDGPAFLHGVELECAAVLCAPWFIAREGHVEDIRNAARADHVVVVEKVTATGVGIDGHVLGSAREWTAACDGLKKGAEVGRVEGIT